MPVPCFLVQAGAEGLHPGWPAPWGFSWELPCVGAPRQHAAPGTEGQGVRSSCAAS